MISSKVQRTLVKSPPELWTELSDPAALARHLGELGEIRITRVEPEKTVEWEAAETTGKVLLKPSGWGTKVTLTANRELSAPEPMVGPEPTVLAESMVGPEPTVLAESMVELEPTILEEPVEEPAPEPEPLAIEEPEPEAVLEEPEPPRPGFFARLFGRRRNQQAPQPSVEPELTVEPEPAPEEEPAPQDIPPKNTMPQDTSPDDTPSENAPDIAAELKAAEDLATEQVTAVLTAALDRLGAAHHRPFSRA